jgi:predicted Zn-ribbon and HTH transcriptional regulator
MNCKMSDKIYGHVCKRCGYEWKSAMENPSCCANGDCRRRNWNQEEVKEGHEIHIPIPTFEYNNLPLKHLGSRCPNCGGTTGMSNDHNVAFCYSCDSTWNLISRQFMGVMVGIGVR